MNNRNRWIASHTLRHTMARAAVVLGLIAPLASCTNAQLEGESPSYLIISSLAAASGATPDQFGGSLPSDVLTFVQVGEDAEGNPLFAPTIYEDVGEVQFDLGLKDPGTIASPNQPSTANVVTITRYRVDFIRSDGRNTPGVDVPYGFDGAMTVSVGAEGAVGGFSLVRIQAKLEAPLRALINNGGALVISTLAEVTFYGHDQAGRPVSVTGLISVNFSDWGDPR